jgi:cytochrome b561
LAALVVVVGVLGLADDSPPRRMVESWINIHALFGLLLCGVVIAEYRRRAGNSPGMQFAHGRTLCRQLSRIVYLSLYVIVGVRQCISLANAIWHGGTVDFNLLEPRFRAGPDSGVFDPKDDFQMFLASGLFALIVVRALAFRRWLRFSAMRDRW